MCMSKMFCLKDVFAKHGPLLSELGVNVNNGLGDLYDKIKGHPKHAEVEEDIKASEIPNCVVKRQIGSLGTPKLGLKGIL